MNYFVYLFLLLLQQMTAGGTAAALRFCHPTNPMGMHHPVDEQHSLRGAKPHDVTDVTVSKYASSARRLLSTAISRKPFVQL